MQRFRALVAVTAAALALGACADPGPADGAGDGLQVVTGLYPLEYVTTHVGGDRVSVLNLTKAGAEPHDLSLAPRDVARVGSADLVVYLAGFQPAVDAAVRSQSPPALDVSAAARLIERPTSGRNGHQHDGADHDDAHDNDGAHDNEAHDDEGHDHGPTDPHFWLDPTRLADVADDVADQLAEVDPDGAQTYRANADALRADLLALDGELTAGLAGCTSVDLVVSHEAFGYLADRYGFHQVGISGLSPDQAPRPQDLAAVAEFVTQHGVSTIYYETLVDPAVAETVARESGADTAVLDPLEGLSDASPGEDYPQIMRANLQALRAGQGCP